VWVDWVAARSTFLRDRRRVGEDLLGVVVVSGESGHCVGAWFDVNGKTIFPSSCVFAVVEVVFWLEDLVAASVSPSRTIRLRILYQAGGTAACSGCAQTVQSQYAS
jgi:hypothetical protein